MSDSVLSRTFSSRISAVMEALLGAAALEVTRIFENSVSELRLEIARSHTEVDSLKRRLETSEKQMHDRGKAAAGRRRANRAPDPSAPVRFSNANPETAVSERESEIKGGIPRGAEDSLTQLEGSMQDAPKQPHRVKDEVTDRESGVFEQAGGPEVVSIIVKEELVEPDTKPQLVGKSSPVVQGFKGPGPGDGAGQENSWYRPQPIGDQTASSSFSAPGIGDAARRLGPLATDYCLQRFNGLGHNRRTVACSETAGVQEPGSSVGEGSQNISRTLRTVCRQLRRSAPDPLQPHSVAAPDQFQPRLPPGHRVPRATGLADSSEARLAPSQQKAEPQSKRKRRSLLSPTTDRPYSCALCLKGFISPSHLDMHIRVHTGERPFSCSQCGMRFAQKGNLRAHQRQVHQGKRPFPCPECGKRFTKRGNLRTHQQQVHLGKRPYPCIQCNKAYFSQKDLKIHEQVHSAE